MSDVGGYGGEMPVIDEVVQMTVDSFDRSGLDPRTYLDRKSVV